MKKILIWIAFNEMLFYRKELIFRLQNFKIFAMHLKSKNILSNGKNN